MADAKFTRVAPHTCHTCGCLFTPVKYRPSAGKFRAYTGRLNCSEQCIFAWKAKTKSEYMRANRDKFSGANSWNWKGACLLKNKSYRGQDWTETSANIRRRDCHACKSCGMTQEQHTEKWDQALEVHHKIPFHEFTDHKRANRPANLVTLCKVCHMKADRAIKQRQFLMVFCDEPRRPARDGIHRGSRNGRSKLTEAQVADIKLMIRQSVALVEIAAAFGVKDTVISAISTEQNWKHVPWPNVAASV